MGGSLVTIARFGDESHAHMAAGRLEAEGVDAVVMDVMPHRAVGVRQATLAVPTADVQRSAAILRTTPAGPFLLDAYR